MCPHRHLDSTREEVELVVDRYGRVEVARDAGEGYDIAVREGNIRVRVVLVDDEEGALRVELEELDGNNLDAVRELPQLLDLVVG